MVQYLYMENKMVSKFLNLKCHTWNRLLIFTILVLLFACTNLHAQNKYTLNKEYIHVAALKGKSFWELRLMRNEIYARHGRKFKSPELDAYFKKFNWYKPDSNYTDTFLNTYELKNAEIIRIYERKKKEAINNQDEADIKVFDYSENFDKLSANKFPNNWEIISTGRGRNFMKVDSNQFASQPYSFKLEGSKNQEGIIAIPISTSPINVFELDFFITEGPLKQYKRNSVGSGKVASFGLYNEHSLKQQHFPHAFADIRIAVQFAGQSNARYVALFSPRVNHVLEILPDTWNSVKIEANLVNNTATIWFNNKKVASAGSFGYKFDSFVLIVGKGVDYTSVWVDNIKIYSRRKEDVLNKYITPSGEIYYLPDDDIKMLEDDLNNDGVKEKIHFFIPVKGSYTDFKLVIDKICDITDKIEGNLTDFKIVDIDSADNIKEIAVSESGPSDDYATTFYYSDGIKLISMGKIPGSFRDIKIDSSGILRTRSRGKVLHTWFHPDNYKLSEKHLLIHVPQDLYAMNWKVTVKKPLDLLKSRNKTSIAFTLKVGEKVTILSSDNKEWCLVENSTGDKGWFAIDGYNTIRGTSEYASKYFKGLSYAD